MFQGGHPWQPSLQKGISVWFWLRPGPAQRESPLRKSHWSSWQIRYICLNAKVLESLADAPVLMMDSVVMEDILFGKEMARWMGEGRIN